MLLNKIKLTPIIAEKLGFVKTLIDYGYVYKKGLFFIEFKEDSIYFMCYTYKICIKIIYVSDIPSIIF